MDLVAHHSAGVPAATTVIRREPVAPMRPSTDPEGLTQFSVVGTNRSLNHMSEKFKQVMRDISLTLKHVFNAYTAALVPGSGTSAMESVARQFATGKKCLVLRNGWFSFRWSQILEMGSIASEEIVLKGRPVEDGPNPAYGPCPMDEVIGTILQEQPAVVFAPHVETSCGIMLSDAYLKGVADAVHAAGGIFVLDCVASGCLWVDMAGVGVDVLISAPQKGWSAAPGAGIVMLSQAARKLLEETSSTSFSLDLKKWVHVMEAYEQGTHRLSTMPTDTILRFHSLQQEMASYGFEKLRTQQIELGDAVRRKLVQNGFKSVAAPGWGAPGVMVSYTSNPQVKTGAKFASLGMQISAGIPLMLDDFTSSSEFRTFRLGLFGIDKLRSLPDTVRCLEEVLKVLTCEFTLLVSCL